MRRLALVLAAVVIGSLLGLALDVARTGGLGAWFAARGPAPVAPGYEVRGRTVDIEGRSVYLDCRGAGSPTVLLEAGFGSGADSWGAVLEGVAVFTRVCAWDRPGIGRSVARDTHTAHETVNDLMAAFREADERGPVVVVAHSFGGVYARTLAATSPGVTALVMIDTYEPDLGLDVDPTIPEDSRAVIRHNLEETAGMLAGGEHLDWAATMADLEAAGPVVQPTLFLAVDPRARYVDPDPALVQTLVDAWYRAIEARYPNGTIEVVPGASHMIHLDRPDIVIDRIRTIVERERARGG